MEPGGPLRTSRLRFSSEISGNHPLPHCSRTDPPGCVDPPDKYSPSIGVRYRPAPVNVRC